MKKALFTVMLLLLCLSYGVASFSQVRAAALRFDKTTNSVTNGNTFDVQVTIDPGSEQVTSTDAWIVYDKNILTVVSVKDGTYFPTVLNDTTTAGKVYVAGLVNDPTEFKSGVGTVATITFRAAANGNATLSYLCDPNATETSKIIKNDINSTNIIECGSNGTQVVTVSSGGGGGTTPTTAPGQPTSTPFPTTVATITMTPTPTTFLPSPTISTLSASPSALPQSGVIENILSIALPGILLMTIGSVLKIMLKI